ncbi:histidine kinase [bacterium]|nr:histidine kinase [bacterium]
MVGIHRLSHIWFALFLLVAMQGSGSDAEAGSQPRFIHFNSDQGLSHSKVNCITQDSHGFLWIGTNEGLCRYDGISFVPLRWKPVDPQGISAPLVRALHADRQGRLWIGTESGGLDCLYTSTMRIEHMAVDSTDSAAQQIGHDVNAIIENQAGGLWLATNRGLGHFDPVQKKYTTYLPAELTSSPVRLITVNVVLQDRDGILWLGTLASGLWRFDPREKHFTCYRHDPRNPSSLGDNDIRSLYQDSAGRLWIGTNLGGLNLYHPADRSFEHIAINPNNPESTTIRALLEDGPDHLLLGNRSGMYRLHLRTGVYERYEHDPNDPQALSHNSVQYLYRDFDGDLWIGTRDGLNYLNQQSNLFDHIQARSNDNRFLNNKVVYALLQDRRGDIWFGTEEGGINRLRHDTGRFTYYKHEPNNPRSLSANNIKALVIDRKGDIWAGTFRGGLNVLHVRSGQCTLYRHTPGAANSPPSDDILTLLADREGDIWIGTTDAGLGVYNHRADRFERWPTDDHVCRYTLISALMQDRGGAIWIGSDHGRLGRLDKKTRAFEEYRLIEQNALAVEVRVVFQDRAGEIWAGTLGAGLFHLQPESGQIRRYSERDGLPGNVVYGILEDDQGRLWLSTTEGLVRFDPAYGQSITFTKENGLQSNQFCYNAYLKSRDGKMYFGGINGVTAFSPQRIKQKEKSPAVVLTGLRVNNKPVQIGAEDGLLKKTITDTDHLRLSHRHSVFSIEFAALNYAVSSKNRYQYKMEGFDLDWNDIGHQHVATYTNLNPGEYTLRVKAANCDGVWNETGTSLRITITPPMWKTWWAKIIGLLLLGFIVKHVIDYQNQKKNFFKATSLANLAQLKLLRYQMNPHFLFNAHNSIRSMILIDKERAWQMITEMSEFFRYTLLNFNKLEDTLNEEIGAVNNYLHIEKIRYRDSLEVSFQIDEAARNCQVPSFLFQPLIENAIKYGMRTSPMPLRVKVLITIHDRLLSIDVSNTGRLLEKEYEGGDPEVHGTSLDNIRQRLEIMFKNRYEFRLHEESGWVHAQIRIRYDQERGFAAPGEEPAARG